MQSGNQKVVHLTIVVPLYVYYTPQWGCREDKWGDQWPAFGAAKVVKICFSIPDNKIFFTLKKGS
jgi:hypothetical protein